MNEVKFEIKLDESSHNNTEDKAFQSELLAMRTESPSNSTMADVTAGQKRKKRQDWCRWPICELYSNTGICPGYLPSDFDIDQLCAFAHVDLSRNSMKVTTDGGIQYVRVCFDSMGLVKESCDRKDCNFYHPPKMIRNKIVFNRHEQYLKEKMAKVPRNYGKLMPKSCNLYSGNPVESDQSLTKNFVPFIKPPTAQNQTCNPYQYGIGSDAKRQIFLNNLYQKMLENSVYQLLTYQQNPYPVIQQQMPNSLARFDQQMNSNYSLAYSGPMSTMNMTNSQGPSPANLMSNHIFNPMLRSNPIQTQQLDLILNPLTSTLQPNPNMTIYNNFN